MHVPVIFVLLSVAVLTRAAAVPVGGKRGMPDCGVYNLPMCTREQIPVCASDGKTYSNACMLCLWNKEKKVNTHIVHAGSC